MEQRKTLTNKETVLKTAYLWMTITHNAVTQQVLVTKVQMSITVTATVRYRVIHNIVVKRVLMMAKIKSGRMTWKMPGGI